MIVDVAIVMPTYNQAKFIKQAIDSILAQTFQNWSLTIVDDGSTDETPTIIGKYNDSRIQHFRLFHGGTGNVLNYGFTKTKGRYETWWASDNNMYPTMLEELVTYLDKNPNCDYVYSNCDCGFMDDSGLVELRRCLFSDLICMDWQQDKLIKNYHLGICWLWRPEIRQKCTGFQSEPCEDYDMALQMVENGARFEFLPKVLGWQRRHKDNLTNTAVDEKGGIHAKTRFVQKKAIHRMNQRMAK